MINMLTVSEIPTVDPDFDDLELLYSNPEADCVGGWDDCDYIPDEKDLADQMLGEDAQDDLTLPLASPREQALHDFWERWDERFHDKLDRRSK